MPGTFLGYPFDEELFLMQWQAAQDPVKLAMLNSGAIQNNATIKNLIANGSNLYTIPFYDVLGGEPENYDGQTDITTTEPTGKSQSGVVYGRAHGWLERDFVRDFNSGADPMKQITSQVSRYWDKKRQGTVLNILNGVFSTTDNTGGYDLNMRLSQERADAVRNYLMGQGVSGSRLKSKGEGWANPVATNETAEGRAQNRRVEMFITASQEMINAASQQ